MVLTDHILDVRHLISFEHLAEKFNLLANHFYIYLFYRFSILDVCCWKQYRNISVAVLCCKDFIY